jgi:hypothetical protein
LFGGWGFIAGAETLHEETGAEVAGWVAFNTETRTMIRAQFDDAAYAAACERCRKLATDDAVALGVFECPPHTFPFRIKSWHSRPCPRLGWPRDRRDASGPAAESAAARRPRQCE